MTQTVRLTAAALAAALTFGPAAAQESMSDAERAAFRAEVRAYLLENPEVILEAIDVLEQRRLADAENADAEMLRVNAAEIFEDPNSWVGGNPQGDITVVEFIDYRCGYCRKAWSETEELVASDGNIRRVIKEFPILGEQSDRSSRFAIAVLQLDGADAYKRAHDALITLRGDATKAALRDLAGDLGLNADAIEARMDAPEVSAVIAANQALAQRLQINGTPTFVVKGTLVRGYVPLDGMRQIVEGERRG